MKRRALVAVALLPFTTVARTEPPGPADARELKRISDAWDAAIVRKDRAAIEANMRTDLRQIDGAGTIVGKDLFVDELMAPTLRIHPYTVEDFEIRVYHDVALLSGRTRMTGTEDGKAFRTHYRYIDIYVRDGRTWRIASVQITRMRE